MMVTAGIKQFFAGTVLLLTWILGQRLPWTLPLLFTTLEKAALSGQGIWMALASAHLVFINAFRALFLFNGWFLIADALPPSLKRLSLWLPLAAIPLCYLTENLFQVSAGLHFGMPALLTLASVMLLQIQCRNVSRYVYKVMVQSVLVFSIQWLDVVPGLTRWGFGGGELSLSVKTAAELTENSDLLGIFASTCFIFSFCAAQMLSLIFISYEKNLYRLKQLRQRETELRHLRQEQLRARFHQEVQYLVHDLKRPLTAILGLSDLLSVSPDPLTVRHARRITQSAEQMNQMISEIQTPEASRDVSVKTVLDYTLAQTRTLSWGTAVQCRCGGGCGEKLLHINLIQLSRALVNLLDNAAHAAAELHGQEPPEIVISAEGEKGRVRFIVEDNGPGFSPLSRGVRSRWGSTGMGLSFVRQTAGANGGTFFTENRRGGGARCVIELPEVEQNGAS